MDEPGYDGKSLVLNVEVERSVLESTEIFHQNIQQLIENITTKTNGKDVIETGDVTAVIAPPGTGNKFVIFQSK